MGIFDNLKKTIEQSAKSSLNRESNKAVNQAVNGAVDALSKAGSSKTREISFRTLPTNLAELQALPEAALTDPFATAALTIVALNEYSIDKEAGIEMLEFLNGPDNVSQADIQFLRDRVMDGNDFVARSYFKGATPDNSYTPSQPYTVKVMENTYSRDAQGYLVLWIYSGGADNPREIQLRNKPSTGQWFATGWRGLLSGVRIPKANDPWA